VAPENDRTHRAAAPHAEGDSWPMKVHLQRRRVGSGLWQCDAWCLQAVESDRGRPEPMPLQRSECRRDAASGAETHVWQGLSLTLHRVGRAAYRFNLSSRSQRLFVH